MAIGRDPWAVVLAAGAGERLRALTTDRHGNTIPKQFCSFNGGASLLEQALFRAARVVPRARVTTIVAVQHESWWSGELSFLPSLNVFVQPRNRGTAIGVLLPLLRILARDPDARLVFLPSDHFFEREDVLERSLRDALAAVDRRPERVVLLGIVPDEADADLGWILPAERGKTGIQRVRSFLEKPPGHVAAELMREGGVWNSFILAAHGRALLELYQRRLPLVLAELRRALAQDLGATERFAGLCDLYDLLNDADFSRDVLEGSEDLLSVLPVPPCGWSDLGTPARVARCFERHYRAPRISSSRQPAASGADISASLPEPIFISSNGANGSARRSRRISTHTTRPG